MIGLSIPFTGLRKQYNNLRPQILDATDEVLRSGQVMSGNWTAEFENWLGRRNGVKYAVTCHSGTQALEIIGSFYQERHLGMKSPTILLPAISYPATANAFIRTGWRVHFVDTDARGMIDLRRAPAAGSYHAMCLVGLYGAGVSYLEPLSFIRELGYPNDCLVVEDAAQHWLAEGGLRVGVAAAISFDPTKNLGNYGNGGAVVTNDHDLLNYARAWRDNGKTDRHYSSGTNSRMSEVDAAQMMIKTQYIDAWQARREKIARYWMSRLRDTGIRCLITDNNVADHCFHKFVVDLDQRDRVQRQMNVRRIETKIHYELPLHEMPLYQQYPGPDVLSLASALCRRVLSLPIYAELTDLEVEYIIDQLLDSYEEVRN